MTPNNSPEFENYQIISKLFPEKMEAIAVNL